MRRHLLTIGLLALTGCHDASGPPPAPPALRNQIVFVSLVSGSGYRLFAMNTDGSGRVLIPILTTGSVGSPSVSPDGGRIVYALRDDIWVANADGSGETNLTNTPASERDPAWSPDGRSIAFASNRGGTYDIYLMNPDGTGVVNLTLDSLGDDLSPSWAPDGLQIAYGSNRDGDGEIYVMDRTGSGAHNITINPAQDYQPGWSPDGLCIAFGSTRGAGGNRLFLMKADGTDVGEIPVPGANVSGPAWNPAGDRLAFECNGDICSIKADSTGLVNLTNGGGAALDPSWSP